MSGKKFIASDFDFRLGKVIALTRNRFGWSQKKLAMRLGVTFQQVQKYESGGNRVSAERLNAIAECFDMTVGQMIDGTTNTYLHTPDILKVIEMMYKMDGPGRKFILRAAKYAIGVVPSKMCETGTTR